MTDSLFLLMIITIPSAELPAAVLEQPEMGELGYAG